MLLNLQIRNFILIDQLHLDFHDGFTVITGESGSGKSMILQAISAVCGARINNTAGNSVVKPGADKAILTAELNINSPLKPTQHQVQQLLQNHDLISEDDPETIIIRRIINTDNKSKAYINDNVVSLGLIKQVTELLLNFNTQHTHIHLMESTMQQQLLDQYTVAQQPPLQLQLTQIAQVYTKLTQVQNQIAAFNKNLEQNNLQREYLQEKIAAAAGLDLTAEQYAEIELEHKHLTNKDHAQQELSAIYNLLENNDELDEYLKQIYHSCNKLENLSANGKIIAQYSENIAENLRELKSAVQQDLYNLNNQEDRLADLEQIIARVHEFTRRYKVEQEQIKQMLPAWQEQLDQCQNGSIESLQQRESELRQQYNALAAEVSQCRQHCATILAQQITDLMPELSLKGLFQIQFTSKEPSSTGIDQVQFMVNFSSDLQRWQAINDSISGGELSRLALLLYSILGQDYDTLIFDEIDVGISGSSASNVGRILFNMAHQQNQHQQKRQLICITHQAQTASFADHHLHVKKDDQITAVYLELEQRQYELARIISGIKITDTSIQHAQELIATSTELKGKS